MPPDSAHNAAGPGAHCGASGVNGLSCRASGFGAQCPRIQRTTRSFRFCAQCLRIQRTMPPQCLRFQRAISAHSASGFGAQCGTSGFAHSSAHLAS
eukprot:15482662-Alexandrium_andersonii.AAC.1